MSGTPRSITPRTAGRSSEARCAASSRHASNTQIRSRSSRSWLTTYSSQPSAPCNSLVAAMSSSRSSWPCPGWATSLPTTPNRAITLPFADASHPWPGSGRVAAEHRRGRRPDLLGRHIAEVLGQPPSVTERVEDLPMTVTPEHLLQRDRNLRSRLQGPPPQRIHILGVDGQGAHGTSDRQRREHPRLGDAAALLGPQCPLIPRRGGGRVADHEVRCHRVSGRVGRAPLVHACLLAWPGP